MDELDAFRAMNARIESQEQDTLNSLGRAVKEAGGDENSFMPQVEDGMTVRDLISTLAHNKIRFVYMDDETTEALAPLYGARRILKDSR